MSARKTKKRFQTELHEIEFHTFQRTAPQNMPQKKQRVHVTPRNQNQQEYLSKLLDQSKNIVFALGPAGTGKAQPLSAKIKIPGGWTTMGDIQLNDLVSTPSGNTAKVIGLFPQGEKETFIMEFKDGRTTECCGEHLWEVFYRDNWNKPHIMSTFEILEFQKTHKKPLQIRLPKHEDTIEKELPIDPYVLGCLLGDGCLSRYPCVGISSADTSLIDKLNNLTKHDGVFVHTNNYDYMYKSAVNQLSSGKKGLFNTQLQTKLNELQLFGTHSHTKFIPTEYLNASKSQKIQLLQGLFDTDGYASENNELIFTTTSEQLCNDVVYLIRSIGGQAKVSSKIPGYTYLNERRAGKVAYNVTITYKEKTELVSLERKKLRLRDNCQYSKNETIAIKSITPSGIKECQCILIDSDDHLYITDNFIVTHNTLIACQVGIKLFKEGLVDKIVVTRPAVSVDEEHGFLPGTLEQKMAPWTRPIFDVLSEYYYSREIENMIREGIIEISPLAYMRGRTFKNSFIIADECQCCTPNQMKMLLTRLGEGSQMVITGDLAQADRGNDNGLYDFVQRIKGVNSSRISMIEFNHKDIERHPAVGEVLKIYGEH